MSRISSSFLKIENLNFPLTSFFFDYNECEMSGVPGIYLKRRGYGVFNLNHR